MEIPNESFKDVWNVLVEFSKMFNLTPPSSGDIVQWWLTAVHEMEVWLLHLIRDNNLFPFQTVSQLNWMNDVLAQRIYQLEIAI